MGTRTLMALSLFPGLVGYTLALLSLNLVLATDYPRQPDDGYRVLFKVLAAGLVAWLCARNWYRHQTRVKAARARESE